MVDVDAGTIVSSRYSLLPVDLRDPQQLEAAVTQAGLSPRYVRVGYRAGYRLYRVGHRVGYRVGYRVG